MDRTESIVRNMLAAIEAPLYDVGVLNDRGMLPGLDGIPASAVLERLPLLKYRNARGSHIYIRPSGEHRFTVLDDLDETSLARLSADGFVPCAVVETSSGTFKPGSDTRQSSPSFSAPSPPRLWHLDTVPTRVQRLAAIRTAARLHQLQAEVPQAGRAVPVRAPEEPHWRVTRPAYLSQKPLEISAYVVRFGPY